MSNYLNQPNITYTISMLNYSYNNHPNFFFFSWTTTFRVSESKLWNRRRLYQINFKQTIPLLSGPVPPSFVLTSQSCSFTSAITIQNHSDDDGPCGWNRENTVCTLFLFLFPSLMRICFHLYSLGFPHINVFIFVACFSFANLGLNPNFVFLVRYPYVTGSSVVAIKYKDGILMAADTGGLMLNLVNFLLVNFSFLVAILFVYFSLNKTFLLLVDSCILVLALCSII